MGDVIYMDQWRADRAPAVLDAVPAFFFDPGCPISYLVAERVERELGEVEWMPVSSAAVRQTSPGTNDGVRAHADALAQRLRLPLLWPERYPADTPFALRAAAHAAEIGAGGQFALAVSRLAFCGGFDLEDPETLAEAAAAAGIPLDACLRSARDPGWDASLDANASELRGRGVTQLPAFRVQGRWFEGESGLRAAVALHSRREVGARAEREPMVPAG